MEIVEQPPNATHDCYLLSVLIEAEQAVSVSSQPRGSAFYPELCRPLIRVRSEVQTNRKAGTHLGLHARGHVAYYGALAEVGATMLKRLTTAPVVCTQKRSSDGPISNLMGDGSFK
jgi:hypothetical protein